MQRQDPGVGAASRYLHLGIQLGITVVLFSLGGYWLDKRYETSPFGVAGGAFLGMSIGLYHFIRATIRTEHRDANARHDVDVEPHDPPRSD